MRVSRNRTKLLGYTTTGSFKWYASNGSLWGSSTPSSRIASRGICSDSYETEWPSTKSYGILDLVSKKFKHPRVNGTIRWSNGVVESEFNNYAGTGASFDAMGTNTMTFLDPNVTPTIAYLTTEALARANPNARPDVDPFLFLWELKDFPRILRSMGEMYSKNPAATRKRAIKEAAAIGIQVRFGWIPLINDLRNLWNFAELASKRANRLKKLDKYVSDKISLGTYKSKTTAWDASVAGNRIRSYELRQSSCKCWAVITHRVTMPRSVGGFGTIPDDVYEQMGRALSISSGLHPSTIWNMIPWSWLIDYLGNVGTVLELTRNTVPYQASHMFVMRHQRMDGKIIPTCLSSLNTAGLELSNGSRQFERKLRALIVNPTPMVAFRPLIGSAQQTNLAFLGLAMLARAWK